MTHLLNSQDHVGAGNVGAGNWNRVPCKYSLSALNHWATSPAQEILNSRKHVCLTGAVYVGSKEVGFPWAILVTTYSDSLAAILGHTEEPLLYSDPWFARLIILPLPSTQCWPCVCYPGFCRKFQNETTSRPPFLRHCLLSIKSFPFSVLQNILPFSTLH